MRYLRNCPQTESPARLSHSSVSLPKDELTKLSGLSVVVFALCFLINAIDGINVTLISYLAAPIAHEWNLAPTKLGVVFSALLGGMAAGGILIAPLADRFGRRRLILSSLLTMSFGMILSGLAAQFPVFLFARMIVGVGLGAILACIAALVTEFSPSHLRTTAVALLQGGYPLGAAGTGFVTVWALAHFSWRAILLCSGAVSLAFFPAVFFLLPESMAFLTYAQPSGSLERVNKIRARLSLDPFTVFPAAARGRAAELGAKGLLHRQLLAQTLPLWMAIFCGFAALYAVMSWIPRLAMDAGLSAHSGLVAGAVYNFGAFAGTVALGVLSTRCNLQRLIVSFFVAAAILLIVFGAVAMPTGLVLFVVGCIGISLQGGFNGIYPLMATLYPARIRSAGIGWAIGVGRAGAFLGPLLTGFILSLHTVRMILLALLAIFLLVASASILAIREGEDAVTAD